jgi:3D (Asp-Asp-Asp) domain-containing protein
MMFSLMFWGRQTLKSLFLYLRRIPPMMTQAERAGIAAMLILTHLFLPTTSIADDEEVQKREAVEAPVVVQTTFLPRNPIKTPRKQIWVVTTAYNSLASQTDASPNITAFGTQTHYGIVAANFLPRGTRIQIPDYFGDQIFVVEDRMHPRHHHLLDIWMPTYQEAIQWGRRTVTVNVL